MSSEHERQLRETFEQRRTYLHDKELAGAAVALNDADFLRQYITHRDSVIWPTLRKLKKLVGEYGHDLLIEDLVGNGSAELHGATPVQATLLLQGFDQTYKSASPHVRFSANCPSRTIDIYACDRVPHGEGRSGQQDARIVEDLPAETIEEIFLGVVQRALKH
jgi:hypothetical protein